MTDAGKIDKAFRCLGLDVNNWDRLAPTREDDLKHITSVFRKNAFQHHPDKGGDSETFIEMKLSFEKIRAWYDIEGCRSPVSTPRCGSPASVGKTSPRAAAFNTTKLPKQPSPPPGATAQTHGTSSASRDEFGQAFTPSYGHANSPKSSSCPSPTESERSPRSPYATPTSPKPPTSPRTGMSRAAGGNIGTASRLPVSNLGGEQVYVSATSKMRTEGMPNTQLPKETTRPQLKTQLSQPTSSTTSTPITWTKNLDYQYLSQLSAGELKAIARQNNIPTEDLFEKDELVERLFKAGKGPRGSGVNTQTTKAPKGSVGASGSPSLPKTIGSRKTVLDLVSEYLTADVATSPRASAIGSMKDYEMDSLMKELREELRTARMEASRRKVDTQNLDQRVKERLVELVTEFIGDLKRVDALLAPDSNTTRKAELFVRQMGHLVKHMNYLDRDLADVLFIPRHLEAFTHCVRNGLVHKRSRATRTSSSPLRGMAEQTETGDRRYNYSSAHANTTL
eukprot:GEMP01017706.1.p1 GENE.GEMP01017706.1~~GEMP01017706.1.p1  ORF type:complete len:508 (+),score=110.60 GEMP01017706.1:173-1696(+)